MIKIKINGKDKEFSTQQNLKEIVAQFCQDTRHVIAEVNGQIVKSQTWDQTKIQSGDAIELVSMVGGG